MDNRNLAYVIPATGVFKRLFDVGAGLVPARMEIPELSSPSALLRADLAQDDTCAGTTNTEEFLTPVCGAVIPSEDGTGI